MRKSLLLLLLLLLQQLLLNSGRGRLELLQTQCCVQFLLPLQPLLL